MAAREGKLTPKQARFVENYLIDLNATQAAIRAGYSAKTAYSIGQRLLKHVEVAAVLASRQEKVIAKTGLQRERILREVELMAHSCISNYIFNYETGEITLAEGAPPDAMQAIRSLKKKRREWSDGEGSGHTVEFEFDVSFWDKPGMVKLAGRHKAIEGFSDREIPQSDTPETEIDVYDGLPPDDDAPSAGSA